MSTLKGTTINYQVNKLPDVDIYIVHVETYLNVDFSSLGQVKIQFQTFLKKNQIFWFLCCSTHADLSIDVSITNVGLISTKPGRFLFSGYGQKDRQTDGQTDRHGFRILIWKHVCTQKISTQSSKLVVMHKN